MIQPRLDWVVCKMPKTQERTKTGLYIPESAQEPPWEATVLAVGNHIKDISVGDRVMHKPYAGYEVTDSDWGLVLMLKHRDIEGIIDP